MKLHEQMLRLELARRYPRWLGALCVAVLFVDLGTYALIPGDEGLYTDAARGMAATGDWLVPRYSHVERLNKPPLLYWLMATAFRLFGAEVWTARLAPALAGVGGAGVVYLLGRSMFGGRVGTAGAMVLLTSLWYVIIARSAVTDSLLCCCITLALAAFWWARQTGRTRYYLLFFLACAAGTLTKGPIAFVLPALIAAVYLTLARSWRTVAWGKVLAGAVVYAAVAAPWFVLMEMRFPGFAEYAFLRENLERYAGRFHDRPNPLFYLPVVFIGFFPWHESVVLLARRHGKGLMARLRQGGGSPALFLFVWAAVVLAFFSLGRGKLPAYVLPAFPPLALLIGRVWAEAAGGKDDVATERWQRGVNLRLAVLLGVGGLIAAAAFTVAVRLGELPAAQALPAGIWLTSMLVAAGALCFTAFRRGSRRAHFAAMALTSVLLTVGWTQSAGHVLQGWNLEPVTARIARLAGPDDLVVTFEAHDMSGFPFHVGQKMGPSRRIVYLPPLERPQVAGLAPVDDAWEEEARRDPDRALLELAQGRQRIFCLIDKGAFQRLHDELRAAGCDVVLVALHDHLLITHRARASE